MEKVRETGGALEKRGRDTRPTLRRVEMSVLEESQVHSIWSWSTAGPRVNGGAKGHQWGQGSTATHPGSAPDFHQCHSAPVRDFCLGSCLYIGNAAGSDLLGEYRNMTKFTVLSIMKGTLI